MSAKDCSLCTEQQSDTSLSPSGSCPEWREQTMYTKRERCVPLCPCGNNPSKHEAKRKGITPTNSRFWEGPKAKSARQQTEF